MMGRTSLSERERRFAKPSDMIEERKDAIDAMNPALRKKLRQIEKGFNDLREGNMRYYYRLGVECVEIHDKPDVYGEGALHLVQRALSTQIRTLRKAMTFVRSYNEEELNELLGLVNEGADFRLHWGHMTYLLTLPTKKYRDDFAERAVRNLLDPMALFAAIKKKFGNRVPNPHGRTHAIPKTLQAQIRQILTLTQTWLTKQKQVWNGDEHNVFSNILNAPPESYTEEDLENLIQMSEMMTDLGAEAEENLSTLKRVREHMEAAIAAAANQREAEAVDAAGREQRNVDLDSTPTRRRRRQAAAAS